MSNYIALFDLDETIINCKSLFEVYKTYCIKEIPDGVSHFKKILQRIHIMQRNGISRNEINRNFYREFLGISQNKMILSIKNWFNVNMLYGNLFNSIVVNELRRHQAAGATIIIVSGSFGDCVSLIADHLNVKDFLCINLELVNGIYTGEISGIQTIGDGKLKALIQYISQKQLPTKSSYGYGDHMSDLPFLKFVEHPNVVGMNEELLKFAHRHSWPILS
jgi:HAD superfamily hydrolase (TIGR01490 family)